MIDKIIGNKFKIIQFLSNFKDDIIFEIKIYRAKRTLTQNGYAWALIQELANVLRMSKKDMYLDMLKSYGQSGIFSVLSEINPKGYFKYYEEIGKGEVNGKEFTHYRVYKGSSEFDTKEMSIFIDGIIQECKQQGIETKTKQEIESMRCI